MSRSDRLFQIMHLLRDGTWHTAENLATQLGVSLRTLYRDMERLTAAGFEIEAVRGTGYRARAVATLPPLSLTEDEIEALNLGIAIAAELADPTLKSATQTLALKIDAALPQSAPTRAQGWHLDTPLFADATRGFAHLAVVRAALTARQKLRITHTDADGRVTTRTIRPLEVSYWARVWSVTAWCELRAAHRLFRLDMIQNATPLPELFEPEPGKSLVDAPWSSD